MAKPRIFISSTFYDLRHVRSDLEKFIKDLGYEPVLNERGTIPYGREEPLEKYCYREIDLCDIVVSIIGGRYGAESESGIYSISQMELKFAVDRNKPVYIFVDKNVMAEYQTYIINKDNENVKYQYVDDIRIYKFIEEIQNLPRNNPIAPFENAYDIISYLKNQWSGLFKRLLKEETEKEVINIFNDLKNMINTLNNLINYLSCEQKNKDEIIKNILFNNHPAFKQIKKLLKIPYRVYFINKEELNALLKVRGFTEEIFSGEDDKYIIWVKNDNKRFYYLKVSKFLFDDTEKLKPISEEEWKKDFIILETIDEDDVPF